MGTIFSRKTKKTTSKSTFNLLGKNPTIKPIPNYKVLLLGDSNVGKSSIILRYVDNIFNEDLLSQPIDFKNKLVNINGENINLEIWDTAGQEKYRTITSSFYHGGRGMLLVFDLTNMDSFYNIQKWIEETRRYASEGTKIYLVGNKSDLMIDRKVSYDDATNFALQLNIEYFECSAANGYGLINIFDSLSMSMANSNVINLEPVIS